MESNGDKELSLSPRDLFSAVSQGANGTDIGVLITTATTKPSIAYANEALGALTGYRPEELSGSEWLDAVAPAELKRVTQIYAARSRGETVPRSFETQIVHKSGLRIPVEISSTAVSVNGGPADIAFVFDLRDRKRTEEELRSSEERFRELVDSAPDGVMIMRGTRLLFVNAAAADMLGVVDAGSIEGREFEAFLSEECAPGAKQRIEQMMEYGAARQPIEYHTTGERTLEVSSILLEYEGQPSLLAFARDVTERKTIEARLVQSDRLAAVGMLAAGVAHEINNPLAYVLLNLKYLQRELPKLAKNPSRLEPLLKHVEDASHGAERVQNIVRDLRTFARSDAGAMGPVDLIRAIENALTIGEHEVRHRARLIRDYSPVSAVDGVASKLEQVFLNLVVNAAQALDDGNPQENLIEISVRMTDDGAVVASISDSGPGIPEEILGRIFDPFFTTKPPGLGTGLGLPICRSIVESFGGSMRVFSAPGEGTRMVVQLQPHPDKLPLESERPIQHHAISERVGEHRGQLLIIDDEASVAHMLARMLESQYTIEICTSAQDALAQLSSRTDFDVVLCDVMMPGMNGMDLYEEIQKRAPGTEERFIFMTGGALLPKVSDFLNKVSRPKLEKPFDMAELRRLLNYVQDSS